MVRFFANVVDYHIHEDGSLRLSFKDMTKVLNDVVDVCQIIMPKKAAMAHYVNMHVMLTKWTDDQVKAEKQQKAAELKAKLSAAAKKRWANSKRGKKAA